MSRNAFKVSGRMMALLTGLLLTGVVLASFTGKTYSFSAVDEVPYADTSRKDTSKFTINTGLPLKPTRKISFSTNEGTWMSVDVSPDGQTIVFDLMGDIYTIPAAGGKATAVTTGLSF